jgi:hypothetical protein
VLYGELIAGHANFSGITDVELEALQLDIVREYGRRDPNPQSALLHAPLHCCRCYSGAALLALRCVASMHHG